jgi:hypothetical protein
VPDMASAAEQDKVRELQRTLYRAAKADPTRRFRALYDKVYRRDVLERAWELVRANRGAAGIDKQTIADVEQSGVARLLDELAADLRQGRWRPLPARRVFIPKPGRPTEHRPLSIPAVRDRIVQAAARIVIEPIFEADMLECSFGFRPRGSAHDALQVLVDEAWGGRRWILESDVANCFEAIPHSQLMSAIEERIVDRQILKLLRAMLRAGVIVCERTACTVRGGGGRKPGQSATPRSPGASRRPYRHRRGSVHFRIHERRGVWSARRGRRQPMWQPLAHRPVGDEPALSIPGTSHPPTSSQSRWTGERGPVMVSCPIRPACSGHRWNARNRAECRVG